MTQDLTHIKVGDFIATNNRTYSHTPGRPKVTHELWVVERETPTQLHATNLNARSQKIAVRKTDGKVIGESYKHAFQATKELQDQNRCEVEKLMRYQRANGKLQDLIGKELHQLKLNTEQLEALAKAWTEIKAMNP